MKPALIHRIPLALKMAIIMLMVVTASWVVVQRFEENALKAFFYDYHLTALKYDAQENLLRFIQHLRARRDSVRAMVIQNNFNDYLSEFEAVSENNKKANTIIQHVKQPPWFPPRSLSRAHLLASYALLIDSTGKAREVYNGFQSPLPENLLHPDELLPRLKNTESILTNIEDNPYQLIIKHFKYSHNLQTGMLMVAYPISSEFIRASQGAILGNRVVALLDTNNRVITSSSPDLILKETPLETLEHEYLNTQKSFFDYGESEIDIKFISLVPKSDIVLLVDKITTMELRYAIAYGIVFILSSSLVVLFLSAKVRKVSTGIVDFLHQNLGTKYSAPSGRDELYILNRSFQHMTEEIVAYDRNLKERTSDLQRINEELELEIMERYKAEKALSESHERLLVILDSLNAGVYVSDMTNHEILFVNKFTRDEFGDVEGKTCWKAFQHNQTGPCEHCTNDKLVTAAGNLAGVYNWEFQNTVNNKWYYLQDRAIRWVDGRIVRLEIATDVTEYKLAQNKIKASLREKEVLLKEIHHRAKNNMQVISSLLNLQSDQVKDKKYAQLFHDSRNRIQSMALVHEKLYQSNDLTNINFDHYTQSLINGLIMFYGDQHANISSKVNVDNINLSIDTAIPCGLIINELVSNSLKYAFPDDREGVIKVSLNKTDVKDTDSDYILTVKDNGVRIPDDMDIRKSGTLGLQLVTNLTEHQLQGTIELNRGSWNEFIIKFKELKYKKRL